ncbi:MAG: DUF2335 domain-containing protein [Alphaproteobacteria bacterium]|nr:DUF2335 domain-containing protein [Alphaproteobacteria bacterium]
MRDPEPPRSQARRSPEGLPSPEILKDYDAVLTGSATRIMEMFEREQMHRHQWEYRALRVHQFSTLLGQALGFLIAVAIFASATIIGLSGNATAAAMIWVFGMGIVTMAAVVWWYAKSLGQRPLFARPAMRTNFRPEKQPRGE